MTTTQTRSEVRAELWARAWLTAGALLPYWPLLSLAVLPITDDRFTSDVWNSELPGRVHVAALAQRGMPLWSSLFGGGVPIGFGAFEPLSFSAFALLPVAPALDLLVIAWLVLAAHGTYTLCRQHDATRAGALLAGLAFAGSGYLACQLKHLSIISTVVWLPWGLVCLEHALGPARPGATERRRAQRALGLACFGLVLAEQSIAGFPQSAYYCALVYGAYALYRTFTGSAIATSLGTRLGWLGVAGLAALVGALGGAIALLPLSELAVSRVGGVTFEWATRQNYWPANALTFLLPYVHGDVSDGSYRGSVSSVFWEDYGYIGLLPALLALYAIASDLRRSGTRFFAGVAVIAFLCVLGRETPVYRILFELVPGLSRFRFSTRFLVIVDFALAVLAAFGVSRLTRSLAARVAPPPAARIQAVVGAGICVVTALDLLVHQPRQNPWVDAETWLAPPRTAQLIAHEDRNARVFSPYRMQLHMAAHRAARGFTELAPYFRLRELLEPNANAFWNIATADVYSGVSAPWYTFVWGDHMEQSRLVYRTLRPDAKHGVLHATPAFVSLMQAYGVTHVISPLRIDLLGSRIDNGLGVSIHRVPNPARVRIVPRARVVRSDDEAAQHLLSREFQPDAEVVLQASSTTRALPAGDAPAAFSASARIVRDAQDVLDVRVRSSHPAYVVLADTFYPGWLAQLDGKLVPIERANVSVRAVRVSAGEHSLRFVYRPQTFARGLAISVAAWALLLLVACVCAVSVARSRSRAR